MGTITTVLGCGRVTVHDGKKNPPTHWTTRDGRKVPIELIDDDHLTNCILMVRRSKRRYAVRAAEGEYRENLGVLAHGLRHVNGEMARDAIEEEIMRLEMTKCDPELLLLEDPMYLALCAEAEHRSALEEFRAAVKPPSPAL